MSISFTCPQCHRLLRAKEDQVGKKAKCSGCKQVLTIPAPEAPHAGIEAMAAAALSDGPQEAPAEPEPTTITFRCMYCDEEVTVSATEEGKQAPCPECRRIVKVPLRVKAEPKDWRKTARGPGAGLRRDALVAPEGAWGTATSSTTVSQQALIEAEVILVDREPTPWSRWLLRGLIGTAAVLLVGVAVYGLTHVRSKSNQKQAIHRALAFLGPKATSADGKEKSSLTELAAGEIYRAMGEYYLREGGLKSIDEAQKYLPEARRRLSQAKQSPERDALLIDLAVTQIGLGGDKALSDKGLRLSWDALSSQLRNTLLQINSQDARTEAVRVIGWKLVALGQAGRAEALAHSLNANRKNTELIALVGLEMLRAGNTDAARALAAKLLSPLQNQPAPANAKLPTLGPNLMALVVALDLAPQMRKAVAIPGPQEALKDPDPSTRLGYAQGYACQDKWDQAFQQADTPGAPAARVEALVAVASLAAEKNPEALRKTMEAALALLDQEPQGSRFSGWFLYRVVQLAVQAGLADRAQKIAEAIPDAALRGRAQLVIFRHNLSARNQAETETLEDPSKQAGNPLILEALCRHNARFQSAATMLKALETWESKLQPYGYIGMALGEQDSGP